MFIERIVGKPIRALGATYKTVITKGKYKDTNIKICNNYVNDKLRTTTYEISGKGFMKNCWKSFDENGKVDYRSYSNDGSRFDVNA